MPRAEGWLRLRRHQAPLRQHVCEVRGLLDVSDLPAATAAWPESSSPPLATSEETSPASAIRSPKQQPQAAAPRWRISSSATCVQEFKKQYLEKTGNSFDDNLKDFAPKTGKFVRIDMEHKAHTEQRRNSTLGRPC